MENQNKVWELNVVLIDFEIKESGGGPKKSFVFPGHQKAEVGDQITWKMRNTGGTFYFPDEDLFGEREIRVKKGEEFTLTVKEKARGNEYPYAILTDNNDFAEGGSFPRMIIR